MKVFSSSKWLGALAVAIPLLVFGVGWWLVGEPTAGVIVISAMVATVCQIVMTLRADVQTVIDVEYEVYQNAAKIRQSRLLEWQERQDRIHTAATIHDSVINTLCAASMMTPGTRDVQLKDRCRHDLTALQEFVADSESDADTPGAGDSWLADLSERVSQHSAQVGLATTMRTDSAPRDPGLERHTMDSLELAVRESLTNIAKHSDGDTALVVVSHDNAGLKITVTDSGSGWSPEAHVEASEFSLFSLGADIQVAVASDLTKGLTVEIRPPAQQPKQPGAIQLAVRDYVELPLFRTINFWLTGLCILVMVMFFDVFSWPWWLLTALLVVSSSMTVTNLYSLSRRIQQPLLYAVAASAGILVASPVLLEQPRLGHWYVLVPATILLITASWTGASIRCAWVTLLAIVLGGIVLAVNQVSSGVVAGQFAWVPWAMIVGTVVVGSGIVLGSRWIRGVIDRSADRTEAELSRLAEEDDFAELHARRMAVRQHVVGRCMDVANPLLSGIADGEVDLGDAGARDEIRYVERLLRSAISLSREQDQLSEMLFDLLWSSYDRGVEVKIASYRGDLLRDTTSVDQLRDELNQLVDSLPAGSTVSVSTYETDAGAQLLLVSQSPNSEDQTLHQFEI